MTGWKEILVLGFRSNTPRPGIKLLLRDSALLRVRFFPIHPEARRPYRGRVWNCIIRQGSVHLTRHVFFFCVPVARSNPWWSFQFFVIRPSFDYSLIKRCGRLLIPVQGSYTCSPEDVWTVSSRFSPPGWLPGFDPEGSRIFYAIQWMVKKDSFLYCELPKRGRIKNETIMVRCWSVKGELILLSMSSFGKQTDFN